jgi:hypothetical protein
MVGVLGAVILLAGLSFMLTKTSDETREAATSTTVDPAAPPPIGQIPLGGRSTTTAAPEGVPGWQLYRAPDGTFSISFPGKPRPKGIQQLTTAGPLTGLEAVYDVGTDGPQYSADYLDLPTASFYADSQDLFDKQLAASFNDLGALDVGPGFSAVQYSSKSGQVTRGFVLVKAKRAYFIEVRDVSDEDFQKFVTSFRWIKDPA